MSSDISTTSSIDDKDILLIEYLPKDKILFRLWKYAVVSDKLLYCRELQPHLTEEQSREDINFMIMGGDYIKLTSYYGRMIFSDITGEHFDTFAYNMYSGKQTAQKVVNQIKLEELQKTILNYYIHL